MFVLRFGGACCVCLPFACFGVFRFGGAFWAACRFGVCLPCVCLLVARAALPCFGFLALACFLAGGAGVSFPLACFLAFCAVAFLAFALLCLGVLFAFPGVPLFGFLFGFCVGARAFRLLRCWAVFRFSVVRARAFSFGGGTLRAVESKYCIDFFLIGDKFFRHVYWMPSSKVFLEEN